MTATHTPSETRRPIFSYRMESGLKVSKFRDDTYLVHEYYGREHDSDDYFICDQGNEAWGDLIEQAEARHAAVLANLEAIRNDTRPEEAF